MSIFWNFFTTNQHEPTRTKKKIANYEFVWFVVKFVMFWISPVSLRDEFIL